jgi:hypothetical protein
MAETSRTGEHRQEGDAFARATETVQMGPRYGEGRLVVAISFVALVFSAISLYETVLRQPRLTLHLSTLMHYARDREGFDAFILPLTIANHGARQGGVLSLRLTWEDPETGKRRDYLAQAFTNAADDARREAIAPIIVPGHGAYSGAILLRANNGTRDFQVRTQFPYRFRLTTTTEPVEDYGWFDRIWAPRPPSRLFIACFPWFAESALGSETPPSAHVKDIAEEGAAEGWFNASQRSCQ